MSRLHSRFGHTAAFFIALAAAPIAHANSWETDGILVEAANEGRYVNVLVDANRYEGFALDGLKGFDLRSLTVEAGSTVGCGQMGDDGSRVRCWRTGFVGFANGEPVNDGTVKVHLYAGSIRQVSVTRVITLSIVSGRFQVQSVNDPDATR